MTKGRHFTGDGRYAVSVRKARGRRAPAGSRRPLDGAAWRWSDLSGEPRVPARAREPAEGYVRATPSSRAWSATAAVTAGATRWSKGLGMT